MPLPYKVNSQEYAFLVEAHGVCQYILAVLCCVLLTVSSRSLGFYRVTIIFQDFTQGWRQEIRDKFHLRFGAPGPTTLFSFDIRSHLWKHRD